MTNPYQSPAAERPSAPSRLTRTQRRSLEFYWKHRERPMTPGTLLRMMLPHWAARTFVFFVIGAAYRAWIELQGLDAGFAPILFSTLFGILAGTVARDVAHLRAMVVIWPVLNEVLEWNAIQEKLEQP